jgi:hypothetical protein
MWQSFNDDYHFNITKINKKFVPNHIWGKKKLVIFSKLDIFYVIKIKL